MNGKSWYQLPVEEVYKALQSGNAGLTSSEAKARLGQYGYNELEIKKRGPLVRFLLQFHNALLYVLLAAAIVAGLLGEFIDMWVIIGVVLATVAIGFIQEGKAEASLEALKKMLVSECLLIRAVVLVSVCSRAVTLVKDILYPSCLVRLVKGDIGLIWVYASG